MMEPKATRKMSHLNMDEHDDKTIKELLEEADKILQRQSFGHIFNIIVVVPSVKYNKEKLSAFINEKLKPFGLSATVKSSEVHTPHLSRLEAVFYDTYGRDLSPWLFDNLPLRCFDKIRELLRHNQPKCIPAIDITTSAETYEKQRKAEILENIILTSPDARKIKKKEWPKPHRIRGHKGTYLRKDSRKGNMRRDTPIGRKHR